MKESTLFEVFCDVCYYDQWAVRPVGEKRWGHCYHLPSKEEAEGLAKELTLLTRNAAQTVRPIEGHASKIVGELPEGFYFFKDPDFPETWGMIDRRDGKTWRVGEVRPMPDSDWDDRVAFYRAFPPNP